MAASGAQRNSVHKHVRLARQNENHLKALTISADDPEDDITF
jgi:hypothetical protein